jgi:hypothetical protein
LVQGLDQYAIDKEESKYEQEDQGYIEEDDISQRRYYVVNHGNYGDRCKRPNDKSQPIQVDFIQGRKFGFDDLSVCFNCSVCQPQVGKYIDVDGYAR